MATKIKQLTVKDTRPKEWLVIRGEEYQVQHGITPSGGDKFRFVSLGEITAFVNINYPVVQLPDKEIVKGKGDDEEVTTHRRYLCILPGQTEEEARELWAPGEAARLEDDPTDKVMGETLFDKIKVEED